MNIFGTALPQDKPVGNEALIYKAQSELEWFTNTDEVGYESLEVLQAAKARVEMLQLASKHVGGLNDTLYKQNLEAINEAYEKEKKSLIQ